MLLYIALSRVKLWNLRVAMEFLSTPFSWCYLLFLSSSIGAARVLDTILIGDLSYSLSLLQTR